MSPNIRHFTFASKAVDNNHFLNHQHNNQNLKVSSTVHMKDYLQWLKQVHKNTKVRNATTVETRESGAWRDSRLNRCSTIFCTLLANMPKTNKPKEWTTRTRARVRVCTYWMRRVNERMTHTHIYTCHVSLLYFLAESNVIYWMIIHAMDRLNLIASFLTKAIS